MKTISRRLASHEDAVWVGMHLREADRQEAEAVTPGTTGVEAVLRAYHLSPEDCFTLLEGQEPIALFGCVPHGDQGIIWLLGTDRIKGKPFRILRVVLPWLEQWTQQYPGGLVSLVDARNDLHLRWCRLAGFRQPDTVLVNGLPFHLITRHREAQPLV